MRAIPLFLALTTGVLSGCHGISNIYRTSWQQPTEVIVALALEEGDRVADIGSGDGFFVPYLSDAVGRTGRVYAVDVEAEITARLENRFDHEGSNVETILAEFHDPKLPDHQIDVVLIVNTYHHIEDRPVYFAQLRDDLTATGRVAIVEPNEDLTGIRSLFLDEGHISSAPVIVREMENAGYRHVESHDFLPTQVFEIFEPRRAQRSRSELRAPGRI